MVKSKTKIGKQIERKNSKELVDTILAAKKKKGWLEVAGILSGPRRNQINFNLKEISEKAIENETILIPGKVLSQGDVDKKIKIVAMGFSARAKEKLEKGKIPLSSILEEIKKNPEAKNLKIIK